MNVLHISTSDIKGGAATAAQRLHKALLKAGIDSKMLVKNKCSDGENIFAAEGNKIKIVYRSIINYLYYKMFDFQYNKRSHEIFPIIKAGVDITKNEIYKKADIIHLHNIIGGYLTLEILEKILKSDKRVVWTLHDMWAFTGGCHYSRSCRKYENMCFACKLLKSDKKNDLSRKLFDFKAKIYNNETSIICTSHWLKNKAQKSALLQELEIDVIANILDESVFKKIDKNIARDILNLEEGKKYILFGAIRAVNDSRKGWDLLRLSLNQLNKDYPELEDNTEILVFGASHSENINELPYKTIFMGKINDEISLSLIYNAADLFVGPSREEAFGQTFNESIFCGTPVVAFRNTGAEDIIKHKKNGYLAENTNIFDLAEGIKWALDNLKSTKVEYDYLKPPEITKKILNIYLKQARF